MVTLLTAAWLALPASGVALAAQATLGEGSVIHGTLSFDGRATAGDFVGTTDSVRGELRGGPELGGVTGWVEAPVTTLRTGNGHRDRDLNSSMESGRYPLMRFELAHLVPGAAVGDARQVTLDGTLTLHGRARHEELTALVYRGAGTARVTTSFQLNLKDYGIGGLSKMLGLLRMNEVIVVHVDVTFGARQ